MTVYLKHRETGEILPFNPDVAMDPDMLPCDVNGVESPELEVLDDPSNVPPKGRKAKKAEPEPDEFLSGIKI